jgi:hypothetical protein
MRYLPPTLTPNDVLLREPSPTVAVRVLPGFAVQARDDYAPSVPRLWCEGEEIPNLAADEAPYLLVIGAVEVVG